MGGRSAGLQRARLQRRAGGRPQKQCGRDRIVELRRSGMSLAMIAAQMVLSQSSVARLVAA